MLRQIFFTLLTVVSTYFCISLGFMIPLAPFSLIVFFHTQNKKYISLLLVFYFGLLGFNHDLSSVLFVFAVMILSIYLYLLSKRQSSLPKLISEFSVITGLCVLSLLSIALWYLHFSPSMLVDKLAIQLTELSDWMMSKDPSKSTQFLIIKTNAQGIAKDFIYSLPSYLFIFLTFTAWLNLTLLSRHQIVKNLIPYPAKTNLSEFRAPFWLAPLLLVSLSYFTLTYGQENTWILINQNLLKIILIPFFFQGLSVIYYFMTKFKFGSFSRSMIICLFFIPVIPLLSSVIIGILDLFRDFRKKIGKGKIHASNT